jgi:hypothetical protein
MLKNWRTIAKIVVAVITALLGAVGVTATPHLLSKAYLMVS